MVRGELRDRFIETLTELGGRAGNKRLLEALGWAEGTYWNIHGALIDAGVITAGRGRGGSVALAGAVATPSENNNVRSITPVSSQTPHSSKAEKTRNGNGANLGFEAQMFLAADKLRKNLEPSDYKHVALGLIFLKYISIGGGRVSRQQRGALGLEGGTPLRPGLAFSISRIRTNTSPKTCSGCRRRRAGRTCKPTPSSQRSAS